MTVPETAIEEIKEILKKHDLAGAAFVCSEGEDASFLYHVTPTWSCATLEKHPGGETGIRIKAKRKDFPSAAAHAKCIESTVSFIMYFLNESMRMSENMEALLKMLSRHFDISHWEKRR